MMPLMMCYIAKWLSALVKLENIQWSFRCEQFCSCCFVHVVVWWAIGALGFVSALSVVTFFVDCCKWQGILMFQFKMHLVFKEVICTLMFNFEYNFMFESWFTNRRKWKTFVSRWDCPWEMHNALVWYYLHLIDYSFGLRFGWVHCFTIY